MLFLRGKIASFSSQKHSGIIFKFNDSIVLWEIQLTQHTRVTYITCCYSLVRNLHTPAFTLCIFSQKEARFPMYASFCECDGCKASQMFRKQLRKFRLLIEERAKSYFFKQQIIVIHPVIGKNVTFMACSSAQTQRCFFVNNSSYRDIKKDLGLFILLVEMKFSTLQIDSLYLLK